MLKGAIFMRNSILILGGGFDQLYKILLKNLDMHQLSLILMRTVNSSTYVIYLFINQIEMLNF